MEYVADLKYIDVELFRPVESHALINQKTRVK